PNPTQKSSAREDFRGLLKNGPWIAMFILTVAHFIVLAMRGGTMYYYFQYYVDKGRLFDFLSGMGLADSATASGIGHYLLNTFGLLVDPEHKNVASVGYSLFN